MGEQDPALPLCVYYLCHNFYFPTSAAGTLSGTDSAESPSQQGSGVGTSRRGGMGVKGGHER